MSEIVAQLEAEACRGLINDIFDGMSLKISRIGDGSLEITSGRISFSVAEGSYEYLLLRIKEEAQKIREKQNDAV